MKKPLRVLLIEDNEDDAALVLRTLHHDGFDPTSMRVDNATDVRAALSGNAWDIVICDHAMPQFDSFAALTIVQAAGLDLPFIVVSGTIGEEVAVDAMRAGAHDYVMKGSLLRLVPAVERELGEAEQRRQRRQAEHDLHLTQFAMDHSADAVFWINAEGRFIYANEAACRTLGYSRDVLCTMAVYDIDRQLSAEAWSVYWHMMRHAPPRTFTSSYCAQGGRIFPAEITVTYLTFQGQEYHCAFVRDLTERKRAEDQLRETQKMQAMGTLAGGIAHDFNNILAAIMGYTELTLDKVPPESIPWQYLQHVLTASHRARDLVRQILTFSRQDKQDYQLVQLSLVVKEVLSLLRASLPTTIEIQQYLPPDIGWVVADPTQLHQVLMNLCTNAEHAMRQTGGVLGVRVDRVEVDDAFVAVHPTLQPGVHICVTVQDTGHGIAPEVLERMFEPFYTTKAVSEGTGMGLAVVHSIIVNHGGAITVESRPGHGTTFAIYLPQSDVVPATNNKTAEPLLQGKNCILFVDDEVMLAELAQVMLEQLGYDVVTQTKSIEALETFRAMPERFDVVITDQTMPEMSGDHLARELRRIRPDIPIILCTGFSHVINADKAEAMGFDAFCLKPLATRDLAMTIQQVLTQRAAQQAGGGC